MFYVCMGCVSIELQYLKMVTLNCSARAAINHNSKAQKLSIIFLDLYTQISFKVHQIVSMFMWPELCNFWMFPGEMKRLKSKKVVELLLAMSGLNGQFKWAMHCFELNTILPRGWISSSIPKSFKHNHNFEGRKHKGSMIQSSNSKNTKMQWIFTCHFQKLRRQFIYTAFIGFSVIRNLIRDSMGEIKFIATSLPLSSSSLSNETIFRCALETIL